jgi:diamine N-acetyltransferase
MAQDDQHTGIQLCAVTRDNWRAALHLAVHPEQQRFVADVTPIAAIALAKAFIRPGGLIWDPYAFIAGAQMVGFAVLAYQPDSSDNYWLYHFFIDARYQSQGNGTCALRALLSHVALQHRRCECLQLTVHPENERARRLYANHGFAPTGEHRDGEIVYRCSLTAQRRAQAME